MKVHQVIFSPTGGTRRVSECLAAGLKADFDDGGTADLCVKEDDLCLPCLDEDDLAVIAMPVYAGRIPPLAAERLQRIEGHRARCVVVAVYGNRAYDDALLELHDVASASGFRVIAAVGAVAEHSIIRKYGQGRPDAGDATVLREFGRRIARKVLDGNDGVPAVPGNRPYRQPVEGPHPTAHRKCNACGVCAMSCPVGAIAPDDLKKVDGQKCISCMKCVAACPSGARGIGLIMHSLIAQMIKKACASRKENELFI